MSLMLMLVFSVVLMTGVLVRNIRPGAPIPRGAPMGWRRGSRSLALALMLVMGSVTAAGASAKSAETTTAQPVTPVAAGAPTGATVAPVRDYASREASARGLEKFKGGDTTIVLGSGLLIVILIVVLIVVLL